MKKFLWGFAVGVIFILVVCQSQGLNPSLFSIHKLTAEAQTTGKEFIIQGFIVRDINGDNVIDEIQLDYQRIDNGKTGMVVIPLNTSWQTFMQNAFNAVKDKI